MKVVIFNLALFIGIISPSLGQTEKLEPREPSPDKQRNVSEYRAWLTTLDGEELKGILAYADEEIVLISDGFKTSQKKLIQIPFQDIDQIKLKRKNTFLKGGVTGAIVGVSIALLITKDVSDRSANYFVSARSRSSVVSKAVINYAITGARIGSKLTEEKAHFMFKGNEFAYKNQLNRLKSYCCFDDLTKLDL